MYLCRAKINEEPRYGACIDHTDHRTRRRSGRSHCLRRSYHTRPQWESSVPMPCTTDNPSNTLRTSNIPRSVTRQQYWFVQNVSKPSNAVIQLTHSACHARAQVVCV